MRSARVPRSAIVNPESVLHLGTISHSEFEVVLQNGSRSRISRTYRASLERRLGQSLLKPPTTDSIRLPRV
jgi:two-component system LytT family response regulator